MSRFKKDFIVIYRIEYKEGYSSVFKMAKVRKADDIDDAKLKLERYIKKKVKEGDPEIRLVFIRDIYEYREI